MTDDISTSLDDWFTHGESMTLRNRVEAIVDRIEEEHAQYVLDWQGCESYSRRAFVGMMHRRRRKRLIDELMAIQTDSGGNGT